MCVCGCVCVSVCVCLCVSVCVCVSITIIPPEISTPRLLHYLRYVSIVPIKREVSLDVVGLVRQHGHAQMCHVTRLSHNLLVKEHGQLQLLHSHRVVVVVGEVVGILKWI